MKVNNYNDTLAQIKQSIQQSQRKAVLSVNQTLVELYWEVGRQILKQQKEEGWGAKVIQQLSRDLKQMFPKMKGLSERNLKYMRQFAQTYTDFQIVHTFKSSFGPLVTNKSTRIITNKHNVVTQRRTILFPVIAI